VRSIERSSLVAPTSGNASEARETTERRLCSRSRPREARRQTTERSSRAPRDDDSMTAREVSRKRDFLGSHDSSKTEDKGHDRRKSIQSIHLARHTRAREVEDRARKTSDRRDLVVRRETSTEATARRARDA
jgi:hypothetical protein